MTDNVGTDGTDTLTNVENLEFADQTIDLTAPQVIVGTAGNDTLNGLLGDDTIQGLAGDDTLTGNAGNDTLEGGDGNDVLNGGSGGDVLDGGNDTDTVSYSGSLAAVTVDLGTGSASGGQAAGDSFISIENVTGSDLNDTLTGDAGNNVLDGKSGDDTLDGGDGDDTIFGRAGNDVLVGGSGGDTYTGGAGADIFSFFTNSDHDTITDFESSLLGGSDQIDLGFANFNDFADITMVDDGSGNVTVTLSVDDTITLDNISVADLSAADFIL